MTELPVTERYVRWTGRTGLVTPFYPISGEIPMLPRNRSSPGWGGAELPGGKARSASEQKGKWEWYLMLERAE